MPKEQNGGFVFNETKVQAAPQNGILTHVNKASAFCLFSPLF